MFLIYVNMKMIFQLCKMR